MTDPLAQRQTMLPALSGSSLTLIQRQLASLKTRREQLYERVSRCNELSNRIKTEPSEIESFKSRCSRLKNSLQEFEILLQECHVLELEINPDFNATLNNELLEMFEDMYYHMMEVYDDLSPKNPGSTPTSVMMQTTAQPMSVKLPQIELRTFGGTLKDWPEFKANFESLIHNNASLSSTAKYHYLRSSLTGPALALVKELPLTEDNYPIAYETLTKRYENNRLLGAELLNRLTQFPVIRKESEIELSKFVATFTECVASLNSLPIKDLSNFITLHLALKCLPIGLQKAFERTIEPNKIPLLADLIDFVQKQTQILELVRPAESTFIKPPEVMKDQKRHNFTRQAFVSSNSAASGSSQANWRAKKYSAKSNRCIACKDHHFLHRCAEFQKMNVTNRRSLVFDKKLCFNCLSDEHRVQECSSPFSCKTCNKRHHSLLHDAALPDQNSKPAPPMSINVAKCQNDSLTSDAAESNIPIHAFHTHDAPETHTNTCVLGTAVVLVKDGRGKFQHARALIDSASMTSFMTSECAARLNLSLTDNAPSISGLGNSCVADVKGTVSCEIKSRFDSGPLLTTVATVLDRITTNLPSMNLPDSMRRPMKGLKLADPKWNQSAPIDILVGGDLYHHIYDGRKFILHANWPVALSSIFGWVLTGKYEPSAAQNQRTVTTLLSINAAPIEQTLKKFWEIEEPPHKSIKNPEDIRAEEIFKREHTRDDTGRYLVPLPLKDNPETLGHSYEIARNRLLGLEKRFKNDPTLKTEYQKFMKEYQDLGHMTLVAPDAARKGRYYIPHFGIWRLASKSTKMRTVFDASVKSSTGVSLNDLLLSGPKLQSNICEILTNFRIPQIVFTADICKMFRQILVLPEYRSFQHILWRDDSSSEILEFQLNTVTYGETPSPFLALRTLHQLIIDEGANFPLAANILKSKFYVDDCLAGANTVTEARESRNQLIAMLKKGNFELRKWSSNRPELLVDMPPQDLESPIDFTDSDKSVSLLGIQWNPKLDIFSYKLAEINPASTKRSILSIIARTFDPLGWISPVIFWMKQFIQKLWLLGIGWDDNIPLEVKNEWDSFTDELVAITRISIPRYVSFSDSKSTFNLIGFSDASERGYAAVVYLRSQSSENEVKVNLILGKSKVAPLKPLSIPRLELCGAVLLANLLQSAHEFCSQSINLEQIHAFTDSTIVLSWLRTPPHQLKTFVANRITLILDSLPPHHWCHVISEENPADLASRGCNPDKLIDNSLWWHGPDWLREPINSWPKSGPSNFWHPLELKEKSSDVVTLVQTFQDEWAHQFLNSKSKLLSLLRVTAWVKRFTHNSKHPNDRLKGALNPLEIKEARIFWIRKIQNNYFSSDISALSHANDVSQQLRPLTPFLDADGLLRVGGRLKNTNIGLDAKFPILLPKKDHFTNLVIDFYHLEALHSGPRTTLSRINSKFWILGGREIVRSRLHKCIKCFRVHPKPLQPPMMGDLPSCRVQQARPFIKVGIDFGGPFLVKENKLRNARLTKAYLSLFVCMATKAVHLELVSDLTTEAFLATLTRFVARRGLCAHIFSDNGTNFVGANNHLREIHALLHKSKNAISDFCTSKEITWHFIPPSSPHFGGLWESGIKSAKHHLRRVIGNQTLTFEEMSTLLCRIEATLNSRPLCPLSSDPADINALTPGHFLIGNALMSVPEYNWETTALNRLSRWQLIQQASQSFWRTWHKDYINSLRQRSKWTESTPSVLPGQLVLIRDDNLPPLKWCLGRIEHCIAGPDGIVRVFDITTTQGTLRRSATKLCPLPVE